MRNGAVGQAVLGALAGSLLAATPAGVAEAPAPTLAAELPQVASVPPPDPYPVKPKELLPPALELAPHVHDGMPGRLDRRLRAAFPVAADRLLRLPGCGALFEDLGADGLERLTAGIYQPADAIDERLTCRGRVALTRLGGRRVRLCRDFARLPTEAAAVTLIHEALHHAGLPEHPSDPEAMTSAEINAVVRRACHL